MSDDLDAFRQTIGLFSTGVTVVTVQVNNLVRA